MEAEFGISQAVVPGKGAAFLFDEGAFHVNSQYIIIFEKGGEGGRKGERSRGSRSGIGG